jgi:hypothetical protein
VVTIVTTLTGTLLVLGNLGAVVALEYTGFILNMLCTYPDLWGILRIYVYARTNYTRIMNKYFS